MSVYTILQSTGVYEVNEMFESRDTVWESSNKSTSIVFRYKWMDKTNQEAIDPDEVLLDVIKQVNWGDVHPVFYSLFLYSYVPSIVDGTHQAIDVTLKYKELAPPNGNNGGGGNRLNESWSFNYGSRNKKKTWIKEQEGKTLTRDINSLTEVPDSTKQDLHIDISGNVQGADVYSKACSLKVTKVFTFEEFPDTKHQEFTKISASLNKESFVGYDPETVLYLGPSIDYKYDTRSVNVTFMFIIGFINKEDIKMDTNLYLDNTEEWVPVSFENVKPFDYIWRQYTEISDFILDPPPPEIVGPPAPGEEAVVPTGTEVKKALPTAVYRSKPYPIVSFDALGLSGGPKAPLPIDPESNT